MYYRTVKLRYVFTIKMKLKDQKIRINMKIAKLKPQKENKFSPHFQFFAAF